MRAPAVTALALLALVLASSPARPEDNLAVPARPASVRAPEPDAAAQKQAEQLIRDIYKTEYARRSAADLQSLSRKLARQAAETDDDPAARFVLLREARDLAAQAGDAAGAFAAIDAMAARYAVDPVTQKSAALAVAERAAKTPEAAGEAAEACEAALEEAVAADQYDAAVSLAGRGRALARRAKNDALAARLQARADAVADVQREYRRVLDAEKTLAARPDDADACLAVGRFQCLVKGDWETGPALLAKGGDGACAAASRTELAKPSDAAGQAALGDAWWEVAAAERPGALKAGAQARARFWYEAARARLGGLARAKVDKRLEELVQAAAPAGGRGRSVDLLALIDPKRDAVKGLWQFTDGALVSPADDYARVQIPYLPPEEYTLTVVAERKGAPQSINIGLVAGGRPCSIVLDGWGGNTSTVETIDGRWDNETTVRRRLLPDGKPATIVCTVRKDRLEVAVDGKTAIDWKADYARVGLVNGWRTPDARALSIGSFMTVYHIHKIALAPISGPGKPLR